MNPIPRTLAFVVAAFLSLGAAGLTYWSHRPAQVDWTAEIGEPFFPDFTDPNKATSLLVASFDKDASKTSSFSVEFKDGKWRIPSHNNYPADGKDRLKNTAASVIGITRGTLVGKTKEAHKLHNLLDPLDQAITETEGRGDRITLKDGDQVLVDYIIGKKKEGSNSTYYLRRADEDRFFLTEVKIELSTKFADWIEPDLLDLKKDDIKTILIDRYSVDEAEGAINPGEQSVLNRETATSDWKLEGIDDAAMKAKTSVITAMLGSFDDLKIIGVRRKPEGLSASLSGDDAIKLTTSSLQDLQSRGYFYHPKKGLVSNEGDILVSTFEGVSYVLRFGEVFTGTDIDVEVGSSKETEKKPAEEPKKEGDPAKPDAAVADPEKDASVKKSRFVFITAQFDEAAFGKPPVEPTKPEAPKDDAPATDTAKPAEGEKPADPAAPPAPDPQAEAKAAYEAALKKYETDSDVYRIRKTEYDDKKSSGEKQAKKLNTRFADWYYVISEDLFTELRVKPEDLVEPVTAAAPGADGLGGEPELPEIPPLPNVPKPEAPATEEAPAATPETPAEGEKPAAEGEQPAEPAVPAAEPEKPAAEAPPAVEGEKPAAPAEAPPAAEGEKPAVPAEAPAVEGAAAPETKP